MQYISKIDENEINEVASSIPRRSAEYDKAFKDYYDALNLIVNDGFNPDDTSNTKASIVALMQKQSQIKSYLDGVDEMLVHLFNIIDTGIIQEEDRIASEI